ncbi:hypothetical protein LINPERHAP2_LOCUS23731 [Linum perenne]
MNCAVGFADTLPPVGNCSSQYGKFDAYCESVETNSSSVEEGLAAGPLSEIKQPKTAKAKKPKFYRKTMVVPRSSYNHQGTGDSYIGKGQENCMKNQWSVVDAIAHHGTDRLYGHPMKEGAYWEKKALSGKLQNYYSDRVQVMPGEIFANTRETVSEFCDGYSYSTEGSAKSLCWVPVHRTNPSSDEVGYWKGRSHILNWHCPLEKADFRNESGLPRDCQYLNANSADEHKGVPRLSVSHLVEFHPRGGGMNRTAHSATNKQFHASLNGKSGMAFNHGFQARPVKWVPVAAARASKILQKVHQGRKFNSQCEQIPCDRMNTKEKVDTVCLSSDKVPAVESEPSKPCDNVTRDEHKSESPKKGGGAYIEIQKEADEFVGSRAVIESLTAAYKQQLLSEIIEFTVGYPLADFETFIKSSSPVIETSISSVCEHQMQNVSLSGLWNWYEKPGSFGLKVKIEASRDLNGLMDKQATFDAHFVPSLSAVQLFGYSVHQNSEAKSQAPANLENLAAKSDSRGQKVLFSNVFQCTDHGKLKLISSSPCSSNPELLFEYFESEQPYNRKPLHLKIKELTDSGTSSRQVYGDPQKLVSLTLNELHPASWFSVAWYPIYRIPEGKLRSSFLTYHSLGHYVTKGGFPADSPNNMTSRTLFPAVGLQSLNTQGEFWFDLKRRVYASQKQSVGDSEILKRRLQTLEGNASLLARGCVIKDSIKVSNRQSDYEFFISRKR